MIKLTSEIDRVAVAKAKEAGQEHIFEGWNDLAPGAQRELIEQLRAIDFQLLKHLSHQCFRSPANPSTAVPVLRAPEIPPLCRPDTDPERWERCRSAGEEALASGRVGLVMIAGDTVHGHLGEPVGFLPIGPVSGKSVFQLHAEKVRALHQRYKSPLRWWIVTHPRVHDAICRFFRDRNLFGLSGTDVAFPPQPLLPLVDRRGKIVLTEPGHLALEPNGHGGVLLEFLKEERLAELRAAGIEHLFFFQSDNPLVDIADPVLIGHHLLEGAEVSSKAVRRTDPEEPLGVFCRLGSGPGVLEHGELAAEDRRRRLPDGSLALSHGNAAAHLLSVNLLERLARENLRLPCHTRERTVACVGRRGRRVRPTEPNCLQFHFFLFDALRVARSTRVVECDREREFSPIRNASGDKSPQAAQRALSRLYARWLRSAGATFRARGADDGLLALEISPLYALDERELRGRIELPLEIDQDLYLEPGGRT